MTVEDIIERISIIRTRADMSARELSLTINKNPAYITQLESKNGFEPSLSTLLDICSVCEVSLEEFFYHDLRSYSIDKQFIEFLKTLSDTQKRAIMNLYKSEK